MVNYNNSYNNKSQYNKNQNNRTSGGSQNKPKEERKLTPLDKNYVNRAEKVIVRLNQSGNKLTTSQIRNILSMLNQIYNDVITTMDTVLSEDVQSQLQYFKVKLIYTAGRDTNVKAFIEESQIDLCLDDIGDNREKFILYCRYMEALVAYHKFYGGRD